MANTLNRQQQSSGLTGYSTADRAKQLEQENKAYWDSKGGIPNAGLNKFMTSDQKKALLNQTSKDGGVVGLKESAASGGRAGGLTNMLGENVAYHPTLDGTKTGVEKMDDYYNGGFSNYKPNQWWRGGSNTAVTGEDMKQAPFANYQSTRKWADTTTAGNPAQQSNVSPFITNQIGQNSTTAPNQTYGFKNDAARVAQVGDETYGSVYADFSRTNQMPQLTAVTDANGNFSHYELLSSSGNQILDQLWLEKAQNGDDKKYDQFIMEEMLGMMDEGYRQNVSSNLIKRKSELDKEAANELTTIGKQDSPMDIMRKQLEIQKSQMDQDTERLKQAYDSDLKMIEGQRNQKNTENQRRINQMMQQELDGLAASGQLNTDAMGNLTTASQQLEARVRSRYQNMLQDMGMQSDAYFDKQADQAENNFYDRQTKQTESYNKAILDFYTKQAEFSATAMGKESDTTSKKELMKYEKYLEMVNPKKDKQSIKDMMGSFQAIADMDPEMIRGMDGFIADLYRDMTQMEPPANIAEIIAQAKQRAMDTEREMKELQYGDKGKELTKEINMDNPNVIAAIQNPKTRKQAYEILQGGGTAETKDYSLDRLGQSLINNPSSYQEPEEPGFVDFLMNVFGFGGGAEVVTNPSAYTQPATTQWDVPAEQMQADIPSVIDEVVEAGL